MKIVILAAGFGSRLWPLSTSDRPKQFQPIIKQLSPLQYSYELFAKVARIDELYVLTLKGMEQMVTEQLPGIAGENILSVPERRNTLPHTLYALSLVPTDDDEQILFTTVDHLILQEELFVDSIKQILKELEGGLKSVTLIGNDSEVFDPNAGYFTVNNNNQILKFKEKPSQDDIDSLVSDEAVVVKDTAMFVASKKTFLDSMATFADDDAAQQGKVLLYATTEDRNQSFLTMSFADIATGFYEKATNLRAVLSSGDFIDLGSFGSLYKISDKDKHGNVSMGEVIVDKSSTNNYIFNQLSKPLVIIDAHDSVIVQGESGTVVGSKKDINSIGDIYKSQIYFST
jgi:mannose-1-phosphate guanylyltransferase